MSTQKPNQWDPYTPWKNEMDQLFRSLIEKSPLAGPRPYVPGSRFPAVNVWEDPENYYAEAELPGLKFEDIELVVLENELTIKGRKTYREQEGATYHRRERGDGEFSRILRMPFEIDADRVEAWIKDGVLSIVLPKSEEAKPRKIEIKSK